MDSGGAVRRGTQAGCSRAGSPASILWLLEDLRNLPRWGGMGSGTEQGGQHPRPVWKDHVPCFLPTARASASALCHEEGPQWLRLQPAQRQVQARPVHPGGGPRLSCRGLGAPGPGPHRGGNVRLPAPFPGSSFLMAPSWAANTTSAPWLAHEVPRQPVDAGERAGRMVVSGQEERKERWGTPWRSSG